MRYKSIKVYTSYGEYSPNSEVVEVEIPSIEEAAKMLQNMDHLSLEEFDEPGDSEEEKLMENYKEEFFSTIRYKDGRALLDAGEEDVRLLVPFDDKWYDLLTTQDIEKNYTEWVEMIESFLD